MQEQKTGVDTSHLLLFAAPGSRFLVAVSFLSDDQSRFYGKRELRLMPLFVY